MAKLFRLACALDLYRGETVRPPKPPWLRKGGDQICHRYWNKIYWATPPWISPAQISDMRRIYVQCPGGHHVDHIVPLSSPIVCGLHAPWNLAHEPEKRNLLKSNHTWPGHPCETRELFPLAPEPYQQELL